MRNTENRINHAVTDTMLSQFSEFISAHMGLNFPENRWRDLERGICSAAQEFGFKDAESCIQWLMASPPLSKKQVEILASHLTVGETYFFREKRNFEILKEQILPELIRIRRGDDQRLRIWSTGCSTGEEPYSIAILLTKMIPDLRDWNITILATDINPRFLRKASEGIYNEWSFRDTPQRTKDRYFKKTKEGHYKIFPYIKNLVTFAYLNLAEDAYPSLLSNTNAMDVIFCRNVLMYFTQNLQRKVIQNLYRCLVDSGWLIVSSSEISHIRFSQFVAVNFPGMTLYKKQMPEISCQWLVTSDQFEARQQITDHRSLSTDHPPLITDYRIPTTDNRPPTIDLYAEALALYEQGRYAEAEEKIVISLSMNQNDANMMAFLARVYANQGKLPEALEWCKKAIFADKLNPACHYLLATILQEQGRVEETVISLKRALYLDQNFVLAHFALGNLTKKQGRPKESEKHFQNVLSLLNRYQSEDILPESEGITAGRLVEIIRATTDGNFTK